MGNSSDTHRRDWLRRFHHRLGGRRIYSATEGGSRFPIPLACDVCRWNGVRNLFSQPTPIPNVNVADGAMDWRQWCYRTTNRHWRRSGRCNRWADSAQRSGMEKSDDGNVDARVRRARYRRCPALCLLPNLLAAAHLAEQRPGSRCNCRENAGGWHLGDGESRG